MSEILLINANLIDGTGADPQRNVSVTIKDCKIVKIAASAQGVPGKDSKVIDLEGMTLLPGLTDAHVHFGLVGVNFGSNRTDDNLTTYVLDVVENAELALQEGFTTVRDAGGLDPAFALAVELGQIKGPHILPSGSVLSQTGGHGDQRTRYETALPVSIPGILSSSEICDGVDAVRAAARRQLRQGASQIKIMASGGVMSPTDELESVQFTIPEIAAAVHEAEAAGKYTMAHCHTDAAIHNSLSAGVRSIEHGSILNEETARRMVDQDSYLVATLSIIETLAQDSETQGIPHYSQMKLEKVLEAMPSSIKLAADTGVNLASGSDYLGRRQTNRGGELSTRSKLLGPMEAIIGATSTNARLFRMEDKIGMVKSGMDADLVAIEGDPLTDLNLFADSSNVRYVIKGGTVVKDTRQQ